MITRLLNLCGVYLGPEEELMPPNSGNPDGYWENLRFVDLNEKILGLLGAGWDYPPVATNGWESSPAMMPFRQEAEQLLLRFQASEPWGWKDPRNSLTLTFWQSLIPNLKTVICFRSPLAVAESLSQRGSSSMLFGLNLWLDYYRRLLTAVKPHDRVITDYDAYFCNPQGELRRVLTQLGLDASDESIDRACAAISGRLRHNQPRLSDLVRRRPPTALLETYVTLRGEASATDLATVGPSPEGDGKMVTTTDHQGYLDGLDGMAKEFQIKILGMLAVERESLMSAQEETIRSLHSQLERQAAEKERMQQELAELAQQAAEKERLQQQLVELAQRAAERERLDQQAAEKERLLNKQLLRQAEGLVNEVDQLKGQIKTMQSTRVWRFGALYWRAHAWVRARLSR